MKSSRDMWLLEVSPLVKRGTKNLTYFSRKCPEVGSIISVPLRKKEVDAVVIEVKSVEENKELLRGGAYTLRPISAVSTTLYSRHFIEAIIAVSNHLCISPGSLLLALTPKSVQEIKSPWQRDQVRKSASTPPRVLLRPAEDRILHYKEKVREIIKKKEQAVIITPTRAAARALFASLTTGSINEDDIAVLSPAHAPALYDKWQKEEVRVVIGTYQALSLLSSSTKLLIVDDEGSDTYRRDQHPLFDVRTVARLLAESLHVTLLLAGRLPQATTLIEMVEKRYEQEVPPRWKHVRVPALRIADMTKEEEKVVSISIGQTLFRVTQKTLAAEGNIILFAHRRGYGSTTLCNDCDTVIPCDNCNAPVTLHVLGKTRVLLCHRCGHRRSVDMKCRNCGGWRLQTLGIGVERVFEDACKLFPKADVFLASKDVHASARESKKVIDEFESGTGNILVTTAAGLQHLTKKVSLVGATSLDTFFHLPHYNTDERIIRTLQELEDIALDRILLQTRSPKQPVFETVQTGDVRQWIMNERETRKSFSYPPFKTLVQITLTEKSTSLARKKAEALAKELSEFAPLTYPSLTQKQKGVVLWHLLMRFDPAAWPDPDLSQYLLSLAPAVETAVNPPSIL